MLDHATISPRGTGEPPLVSVLAVCFNHARFVRECLDSIAGQTYPNVELFVLDDASTDSSVAEIERWIGEAGRCVRLVAHAENRGLCATLNEGLSHARGEYVAIVATDDVWLPEKLDRQVSLFQRLPEATAVVYSDAFRIDEDGCPIEGRFIESRGRFETPPGGDVLETLAHGNFIPAMTTLIRRACLDRVGSYDERLVYEDWDMWLRLALHYPFAFSDYVSARYRVLETSLARSALRTGNLRWHESELRIAERWAREPRLSRAARDRHCAAAATHAYFLSVYGHPRAAHYLGRALRLRFSFRLAVFALLAVSGIRHETAARLKRTLSSLAGRGPARRIDGDPSS